MNEKKSEKEKEIYQKPELEKEGQLKDITATGPAPTRL